MASTLIPNEGVSNIQSLGQPNNLNNHQKSQNIAAQPDQPHSNGASAVNGGTSIKNG